MGKSRESSTMQGQSAMMAIALAIVAALTLGCGSAYAADGALEASGTQLTEQGTGNTSWGHAQTIALGKKVIGTFESQDDSNDNLYNYYYKFKTSNRWSVYGVRVASIDGRSIRFNCSNYDGDDLDWGKISSDSWWNTTTGAITGYKTDCSRNSWYTVNIYSREALRYDQFSVTATEYPIIKRVTSVHATKTGKNTLNIGWTKQANAKKYQVRYKAKGGKWATKTVTKNSTALTKLKAGTKYQVQVRSYRSKGWNLDGNKVANYGNWSNVKTIKTKAK